jgi:hypothetical protein
MLDISLSSRKKSSSATIGLSDAGAISVADLSPAYIRFLRGGLTLPDGFLGGFSPSARTRMSHDKNICRPPTGINC